MMFKIISDVKAGHFKPMHYNRINMPITNFTYKKQEIKFEIFSSQESVCTACITLLAATVHLFNTNLENGLSKCIVSPFNAEILGFIRNRQCGRDEGTAPTVIQASHYHTAVAEWWVQLLLDSVWGYGSGDGSASGAICPTWSSSPAGAAASGWPGWCYGWAGWGWLSGR